MVNLLRKNARLSGVMKETRVCDRRDAPKVSMLWVIIQGWTWGNLNLTEYTQYSPVQSRVLSF